MNRRGFISNAILYSAVPLIPLQNNLKIIQRAIPHTGELLPVIGLGTWRVFNIGNDVRERNSRKEVLANLKKYSGKIIDTSPMYGQSQVVVGDLVNTNFNRNDFFYANKVWTTGRESGIQQIEDSFTKMKTKMIDLMQVHNLVDVHTQLKTLRKYKEEGKIRYIGITHYLPSAYDEMIRIIKSEPLDFVHFNYNIGSREAENRILPLAKDLGLAVIINRPFEEGQLFQSVITKSLPAWVKEHGINTWAQLFLKFIISHPAVTYTIPGTSNPAHMAENIQAAFHPLPDEKTRMKMVQLI